MALKTLTEHNDAVRERVEMNRHPRPNGIACPNCNAELVDTDSSFAFMTNPPQYAVHCPACDWKGTRL